jgi:phage/plasmid-like protein (TIGR03299 family)
MINTINPVRQNPLRRFGVAMSGEGTTVADIALKQSGLDWTAEKIPLRTADMLEVCPDAFAIRRSDNNGILGCVGRDYQPYQNRDMFAVFDDLAHVRGNQVTPFKIETAGCFQKGKTVFALCKMPHLGIVLGDDCIDCYLLVSNSHDGRKPVTITPTTIRVVCQNSLRMAEAQARHERKKGLLSGGFAIKHTQGMKGRIEEVKEIYNQAIRDRFATEDIFKQMVRVPLTSKLEREFLTSVFGKPGPDESERAKTIRKNRDDRIAAILASPTSQVKGTKDTAFSLLNATTEFVDHFRPTKTSDNSESADEARSMSAMFGSGDALKSKACDGMMELVG